MSGQAVLTALGVVCLTVSGAAWLEARVYQARQERAFERVLAEPPAARAAEAPPAALDPRLLGRLDVPRLGISVLVREGDDAATLKVAAGHLADSALPWQGSGTVAIAGHRDSFFHRLGEVRRQDELVLTTARGTWRYRVDHIDVVSPEQVGILRSSEPRLALVTCYPFSWVGPAPRRFIVRAKLES